MEKFYYTDNGARKGPVGREEILKLLAQGALRGSDLLWKKGMPEWKPLSEMPDFPPFADPGLTGEAKTISPSAHGLSHAPVPSTKVWVRRRRVALGFFIGLLCLFVTAAGVARDAARKAENLRTLIISASEFNKLDIDHGISSLDQIENIRRALKRLEYLEGSYWHFRTRYYQFSPMMYAKRTYAALFAIIFGVPSSYLNPPEAKSIAHNELDRIENLKVAWKSSIDPSSDAKVHEMIKQVEFALDMMVFDLRLNYGR